MDLKTIESKNSIGLVPLGFNQKAGIFYSKEKRTKELQQQNQKLQQQLNEALQKFQQQNQHLKQLQTKKNTVQNILSVLQLDNEALRVQNQKFQQIFKRKEKQKEQLKINQQQLTTKIVVAQKQLFQNIKKYDQSLNLLQRYQEQIKYQKKTRYAPNSIANLVDKLQKDLELLKKNVTLHQNKLQSKKKYLKLLQKKEQTEIQKQRMAKVQINKQTNKSLKIYDKSKLKNSLSFAKQRVQQRANEQAQMHLKQQQKKKQKIKKFNELTQKRNALKIQNNSKKKYLSQK